MNLTVGSEGGLEWDVGQSRNADRLCFSSDLEQACQGERLPSSKFHSGIDEPTSKTWNRYARQGNGTRGIDFTDGRPHFQSDSTASDFGNEIQSRTEFSELNTDLPEASRDKDSESELKLAGRPSTATTVGSAITF